MKGAFVGTSELDFSTALTWEEGLPRPQWDLIKVWIDSRGDHEQADDTWAMVERQWLAHLAKALGGEYDVAESEHFLVLAPDADSADSLMWFLERCRNCLLSVLEGVVEFVALGKQVVIALRSANDYYRYLAPFYPHGKHGGSGGVHVREGHPHVAAHGKDLLTLENTLAHELTHAGLHHLSMPVWLEEGLAQLVEHEMTSRGLLLVDGKMAKQHKQYWGCHGLDAFWRGEGFSKPGKVQRLCYQLAEILAQLLIEEARPRWFGFVREPRRRFFAFLRSASAVDCGESACREHLKYGISELAAKFLGPGSWSPSL
jgi:hypothetical protein